MSFPSLAYFYAALTVWETLCSVLRAPKHEKQPCYSGRSAYYIMGYISAYSYIRGVPTKSHIAYYLFLSTTRINFGDVVSLCSSGWPHRDLPPSVSAVLVSKAIKKIFWSYQNVLGTVEWGAHVKSPTYKTYSLNIRIYILIYELLL